MNHVNRPDDERADAGQAAPRRIEVQPGATPADEGVRRIAANAARPAPAGGARQVTPDVAPRPIHAPRRATPVEHAGSTADATGSTVEAVHTRREGWDFEQAKATVAPQKSFLSGLSVRKVLIVGGGILVAFIGLVALLSSSGEKGLILTKADQQLLSDYRKYLTSANAPAGDVERKVGEAEQRLKALRWADSVKDKERGDREYERLLLLDTNSASPLYKYCLDKLRRR